MVCESFAWVDGRADSGVHSSGSRLVVDICKQHNTHTTRQQLINGTLPRCLPIWKEISVLARAYLGQTTYTINPLASSHGNSNNKSARQMTNNAAGSRE